MRKVVLKVLLIAAVALLLYFAGVCIYALVYTRRATSHAMGAHVFSAAEHLSDKISHISGGRPRPWADYRPPKTTFPSPNAFDVYLKATKLKDQVDRKCHAGEYAPPNPKEFAGGTWHQQDKWDVGPTNLPPAKRLPLYAGVLKLTRHAFTMDCRLPGPGGIDAVQPYVNGMRQLATLFQMEASVEAKDGHSGAAASSLLDALRVARDVETERFDLGCLAGNTIELTTLLEHLPGVVAKLDAAECQATLSRMLKIDASRVPIRQVIDGEEAADKGYFREIMYDPGKLKDAMELWPGQDPRGTKVPMDPWRSWTELGAYFDQLRAAVGKPFAQRGRFTLPKDLPAHYLTFDWTIVLLHDVGARTDYHLTELQLATRLYLLKRGHLPSRLSDLVPAFIPAIPSDPFGTGPMHAKVSAGTFVIYSVGPDGVDDGGKPVPDARRLWPPPKGDLIVTARAH